MDRAILIELRILLENVVGFPLLQWMLKPWLELLDASVVDSYTLALNELVKSFASGLYIEILKILA